MKKAKKLIVMLPALNEEKAIKKTVNEVPFTELALRGWEVKILVIDGRSVDSTVKIAQSLGCDILVQRGEKGKGVGVREGFELALSESFEALVMLDVDGTYSPKDMTKLLDSLENNKNDIVIGSRLRGSLSPDSMSRLNYLGNHLLTWLAVVLHGPYISDLCTGYWCFKKDAIKTIFPYLNSIRFEIEAEMYAAASTNNLKIDEVPISYNERIGEAKLGSIRDGAHIMRKLFTRSIIREPL